jgi:hypothetical protein
MMCTVLIVGGVQLVMLGVLGEYLWRAFDETRGSPLHRRGANQPRMRAALQRWREAVLGWERRGKFSGSLLLGDAAVAAWAAVCAAGFPGPPAPTSHTLGKFGAGVALLAFTVQLHAFTGRRFRWLLAKAIVLAPGVALLGHYLHATVPAAIWLGAAVALVLVALRGAYSPLAPLGRNSRSRRLGGFFWLVPPPRSCGPSTAQPP